MCHAPRKKKKRFVPMIRGEERKKKEKREEDSTKFEKEQKNPVPNHSDAMSLCDRHEQQGDRHMVYPSIHASTHFPSKKKEQREYKNIYIYISTVSWNKAIPVPPLVSLTPYLIIEAKFRILAALFFLLPFFFLLNMVLLWLVQRGMTCASLHTNDSSTHLLLVLSACQNSRRGGKKSFLRQEAVRTAHAQLTAKQDIPETAERTKRTPKRVA
jgi:hypothetical protein